ncbi:S9 family peptidase [Massilia sp. TS11]|uniref:alpha/beta hydrolase family protein n=1 Tax=Massilia sp. TS11 TaxID=2908003 RepID=UPI001EDAFD21|nr:alpha/beta fold hydrolase [Massilia sp. TS11]MCG2586738.1 alpha/beta fold hydrolase [Massilia sp. TS11]
MSQRIVSLILSLGLLAAGAAWAATPVPREIISDPKLDAKHPPRMEVVHIPTGGVQVNGVLYVAGGPGPHPTLVFFHGLPGNEKNLDLAQAVRRAGWNVLTLNYRGSWGSPGTYSFAQNLEDARAALAFVREPANAARYGIDPARLVIGGHSMGGWVTSLTLAEDKALLGGFIISAGDMGKIGALARQNRAAVVAAMNDNREALAGVSGESMTEELSAHAAEWSFDSVAPKLTAARFLILYSADFVEQDSVQLAAAIRRAGGGAQLAVTRVPTDHSWSDRRIELAALVVHWLRKLPARP